MEHYTLVVECDETVPVTQKRIFRHAKLGSILTSRRTADCYSTLVHLIKLIESNFTNFSPFLHTVYLF